MDEPREIYNGYLGEVVIMRPSELQAMGEEYERRRAEGTLGQFTFRQPSFRYQAPTTVTRTAPIASTRAQMQQIRFGHPVLLLPGMLITLKSTGTNAADDTVSLVLNNRFEVFLGPLSTLLQAARLSFKLRQVGAPLPGRVGSGTGWEKEPYDAVPLLRGILNQGPYTRHKFPVGEQELILLTLP